jgi:hypothetical protein
MIDFSVGHWKHKPSGPPSRTELIDTNGRVVQNPPLGIGDTFARNHPTLFKGCGCKRDVVRVMNRWAAERTTEEKIKNVSTTIANKNKDVTVEEVVGLIGTHLQAIIDEVTQ